MRSLRYHLASESAIDRGLETGRLCALGRERDGDFNDYWFGEIMRFESYLQGRFPGADFYVADHVTSWRDFCVWPKDKPALNELSECCLKYLEVEQPDACAIVASPFAFKGRAGRLVLSGSEAWLDQDLGVWFLTRSKAAGLQFPGSGALWPEIESADIGQHVPWISQIRGDRRSPMEFWELLYSGREFEPIGENPMKEPEGFRRAHEIIMWLIDRLPAAHQIGADGVLKVRITHSPPRHRIIKLECACEVCDRNFMDGVLRLVGEFGDDWGVHFSLFEDLVKDDAYRGGAIVRPDGRWIIESARTGVD